MVELARRELWMLAAMSAALSVGMSWPLALHLSSELPGDPLDAQDVLFETWAVAWGGHALAHSPLDFFDANVFWPLKGTLAFSDSLAGYAPAGLLGHGAHAATLRYGLLFLFAYALAFAGAYLLARELCASPFGATIGGAAFAYAPFRLAHQSHLNVLSSGGIPLALFLLIRGYRSRRPGLVLAGWSVALWQISLGWNLGLPFAYLLALLSVGAVAVWLRRGRRALPRSLRYATAAGVVVCVGGSLLLALPYLHALHDHPEARRTPDILFFFSPQARGLLAAPPQDLVWKHATSKFRAAPANEKSLLPGAAASALAFVGMIWGRYRRALSLGLAAIAFGIAFLSLGFGFHGGQLGYRILYDHFPGWQGLRTPGRLIAFAMVALSLLAAAGADRAMRTVRTYAYVPALVTAAVLLALVLLEGFGTIGRIPAPKTPTLASGRAPELVLPADVDVVNATAMFWSIEGFPPLVNGWSGFHPRQFVQLVSLIHGFPDAGSVRALRAYGVRTVLVDGRLTERTPWANATAKSIQGLHITRRSAGAVVIYDLH